MKPLFYKFTTESPAASYIPFPRFLMDDCFTGLGNDAKVLYALMLDRASISKVNGYIEKDGAIRLYFTVEKSCIAAVKASHGSFSSWKRAV